MLRKRSFVWRSLLQKVNACTEGIKRKMCVFLWQSAPSINTEIRLDQRLWAIIFTNIKSDMTMMALSPPTDCTVALSGFIQKYRSFHAKTLQSAHTTHGRTRTAATKTWRQRVITVGKKIVLKKVKYNGLRLCECRSRCISQGLLHEAQVLVSK